MSKILGEVVSVGVSDVDSFLHDELTKANRITISINLFLYILVNLRGYINVVFPCKLQYYKENHKSNDNGKDLPFGRPTLQGVYDHGKYLNL